VISDGFGRRKPHPAIFRAALDDLQTDARDALFVGDSAADDVAGARAAEMDAVWINASGATLPAGNPSPRHTIARLVELRRVLSIA
ncbi:MAG TPA: HAD family hydrolase, partial [Pseudomonadales bacterium]|nr:HAD family hydrolase [Pseudomonadales bacterium]